MIWVSCPLAGASRSLARDGGAGDAAPLGPGSVVDPDPVAAEQVGEHEPGGGGAELITYCTIGGRAATAWFVLTHLLGRDRVRVYDGSWAEWGRIPGAPVAGQ